MRLNSPLGVIRWSFRRSIKVDIKFNFEPANILLQTRQSLIDRWKVFADCKFVLVPGSQLSAQKLIVAGSHVRLSPGWVAIGGGVGIDA
jgi:hypothetical protein